jgi:hypothetical protein
MNPETTAPLHVQLTELKDAAVCCSRKKDKAMHTIMSIMAYFVINPGLLQRKKLYDHHPW